MCNTLCGTFLLRDALQKKKSEDYEASSALSSSFVRMQARNCWYKKSMFWCHICMCTVNIDFLYQQFLACIRTKDELKAELATVKLQKVNYIASKLCSADFGKVIILSVSCCVLMFHGFTGSASLTLICGCMLIYYTLYSFILLILDQQPKFLMRIRMPPKPRLQPSRSSKHLSFWPLHKLPELLQCC